MGDTGSLAIGSGLAAVCLLLNLDLLLPIVGGLFVLETLSVIAQVVSFRLFGRRIFRMAPFHHHFELLGWPETTVIVRFWMLGGLFCRAQPGHLLRRVPHGDAPHVSPVGTSEGTAGRPRHGGVPPRGGVARQHLSVGRHTIERGRRTAGHRAAPRPRSGLLGAARQLPTSTVLVGLVVVLCVFGVVMVGSASEVVSIVTYGTSWAILLRECLWLVLGRSGLRVRLPDGLPPLAAVERRALVVTFVLLLAVLVPGVGDHLGRVDPLDRASARCCSSPRS